MKIANAIFRPEVLGEQQCRICSKKSVQKGCSHFCARSVLAIREHGKMARTPLAAFFNRSMNNKSPIRLCGILVGLLLVMPSLGWAGGDEQEQPRLTVSAEGKMNVPPDKAVLSFAVETVGKELAKVQKENQERMARVLEECQKLEIASKFIQTTSFNVIPEYPPPPRRSSGGSLEQRIPRIIGYRVVHQINVEVRNLDIVGKVVDRALKVGANRFSGISWGLQDEQPTELQVLQRAATKAKTKAETLARSLKLRLVRIMKVMEGGVSVVAPAPRYRMARAMSMESDGGGSSVSAGEISVRGTVTLVYEIGSQ